MLAKLVGNNNPINNNPLILLAMETTSKKRINAPKNNKIMPKKNNYKKLFIYGVIFIIFVICTTGILHKYHPKNTVNISAETIHQDDAMNISIEALKRAKEMLATLPASDDPYGIKQIFTTAVVVPASFNNGAFNIELTPGKEYCIVFVLPEGQSDYDQSGGPLHSVLYTSMDGSSQLPIFVVINRDKICNYSNDEVSFDYLASMFLHEVIHVYQRSLALKNGQDISFDIEDVKKREKEAYSFQSKFINQILSRNNIDKKVTVPIIDIKKINYEGLQNLCRKVDEMNGYRLGPLASLMVFQEYPDEYVAIANSKYSGEDITFN